MRVAGITLSTKVMQIVLVDGDDVNFTVPFREEWVLSDDGQARLDDYVEIRKRLTERLSAWAPAAVCIEPLEPMALRGRNARVSMFKTAELRGVVAEASRALDLQTEFRSKSAKNEVGSVRNAEQYRKDDSFWKHLGNEFLKKYRDAALLALSRIRGS